MICPHFSNFYYKAGGVGKKQTKTEPLTPTPLKRVRQVVTLSSMLIFLRASN